MRTTDPLLRVRYRNVNSRTNPLAHHDRVKTYNRSARYPGLPHVRWLPIPASWPFPLWPNRPEPALRSTACRRQGSSPPVALVRHGCGSRNQQRFHGPVMPTRSPPRTRNPYLADRHLPCRQNGRRSRVPVPRCPPAAPPVRRPATYRRPTRSDDLPPRKGGCCLTRLGPCRTIEQTVPARRRWRPARRRPQAANRATGPAGLKTITAWRLGGKFAACGLTTKPTPRFVTAPVVGSQ
jgi:hypothetical protein